MYVTSVEINNVKSLRNVRWKVEPKTAAGWHTILGVNGSGKSTFARIIALALIGEKQSYSLQIDWRTWVRGSYQSAEGLVKVETDPIWDPRISIGIENGEPLYASNNEYHLKIMQSGLSFEARYPVWEQAFVIVPGATFGYFSAGFGPFRRFTGGGLEFERKLESFPTLAGHISLFDEGSALSSSIEWLRQLQFKSLELRLNEDQPSLLDRVYQFINQDGFLPGGVRLVQITSSGVIFENKDGVDVDIFDLSDGFRSVLSLTFELLRLLVRNYGYRGELFTESLPGEIVIEAPGVVIIDEVDAHLHPTWQRKIGPWFTKHFPNMQFIVTTHSPFVCQASEKGSIFVLDGEGGGRFLEGKERDRIIYGDILDAYSTGVFGEGMTRSDSSQEKHKRLAELNTKSVFLELNQEELQERDDLRAMMSTDSNPSLTE